MKIPLQVSLGFVLTVFTLTFAYTNCQKVTVEDLASQGSAMTQNVTGGRILINQGADYTNSTDVQIALIQVSGNEMYVTNDPDCRSGGKWESYSPNKPWKLSSSNTEVKVYAKFREKNAPQAESSCVSDSIVHDDIAPTLRFSRPVTNFINIPSASADLLAGDSGSGVERIECKTSQMSNNPSCGTSIALNNLTEGSHFISAVAVDRAGNRSPMVENLFVVDRTPPVVAFNQMPPKVTNATRVQFLFTGADSLSGIDRYECKSDGQASFSICKSPSEFDVNEGLRTFSVRAIDQAGNTSEAAVYDYRVDHSAPTVRITQMPPPYSNSRNATFAFEATDDGKPLNQFQCSLDNAAFQSCQTPVTYPNLVAGAHTFSVRALDLAGNLSEPTIYNWMIDLTAPTVTITSRPAAFINQNSASIGFQAQDLESGVDRTECQINGGTYQTCKSALSFTALNEGLQTVLIRAADRAGNTSTPMTVTFTVDLTKPLVEILTTPTNPTNIKDAVFTFRASDPGSTDPARIARIECQLDGGVWLACTSPTANPLALDGLHTFAVRAQDQAGNLSDVKSYSWLLDTLPPAINISKQPLSVIPNTQAAEILFTVTDSGTGVDSVRCGLKGQLQACLVNDTRRYANLAAGDYIFVVEAKDKIGNVSTKETAWKVELATVNQMQDVVVKSNNRADILVVIDNSGSMNPEQQNMAARFGTFLDQLKGLDWQVAIVTTDVSGDADKKDGRFMKFTGLSPDTFILTSKMDLAVAKKAFADTIQRPPDEGSWEEQGIRATYRAIERSQNNTLAVNAPNRTFFRADSTFSALVVTDADETNDSGTTFRNIPENLVNLVRTTWSNQKSFSFHSIIVRPGDSVCLNSAANEGFGYAYDSLSKLTGGIVGTVCAADYGSQLTAIGQGVVDSVRSATLVCQPLDTTGDSVGDVKITTANGSPAPSYTLDGTKITFATALPLGTNKLEYTCLKPVP